MSRLNVNAVRCEALFASPLRRADSVPPAQIREAIAQTIRQLGSIGCAAWVAQEYGDYPEAAVARMRWARSMVAYAFTDDEPTTRDDVELVGGVLEVA
ncbi:MAG TPA: hypothetical protein VFR67_21760 [Pilimelia sp.]|nr:hypothetical protein [Pilimelia sp.]